MPAIARRAGLHLGGQFAGWSQHQGADMVRAGLLALGQALQNGEYKSGGFAGARLGGSHYVVPGQYQWDSLGLDRGGCFVALFVYSAQQCLG